MSKSKVRKFNILFEFWQICIKQKSFASLRARSENLTSSITAESTLIPVKKSIDELCDETDKRLEDLYDRDAESSSSKAVMLMAKVGGINAYWWLTISFTTYL